MWRLFHGIVPTAMALKSRGMDLELYRRVCGEHEESIMQLFFNCTYAREVWSLIHPFNAHCIIAAAQNDIWDDLMNLCIDQAWIEVLFYTCWLMWKYRNQAQFEMLCRSPLNFFKSISSQMQDFKEVACQSTNLCPPPVSTWIAPSDLLKVNVDAAWNNQEKDAVVAAVVRDRLGATVC